MHEHTYASHACCFLLWGGGRLIEAAADICYLRTRSFLAVCDFNKYPAAVPSSGWGAGHTKPKTFTYDLFDLFSFLCLKVSMGNVLQGFDKCLSKNGSATTICLSPGPAILAQVTYLVPNHTGHFVFPAHQPTKYRGPASPGGENRPI